MFRFSTYRYIHIFIRRMLLTLMPFAKRQKYSLCPELTVDSYSVGLPCDILVIYFMGRSLFPRKRQRIPISTDWNDDHDYFFFGLFFFSFAEHQQTTVEKHKIILRQSNQFGWLYGVICRENRFIRFSTPFIFCMTVFRLLTWPFNIPILSGRKNEQPYNKIRSNVLDNT